MANKTGKNGDSALKASLYKILRALARVCLRYGVPFEALAELAKKAFIDVAYREYPLPGRKQSAARVSVLTGIHRKEIARTRKADTGGDAESSEVIVRSASIIAGWRRDKRFLDGRGAAAALSFDRGENSFAVLVKDYGGGDVPPRAALDELMRVDAAKRLRDGRVRLLADAYVPSASDPEGLAMLGRDVSNLITVIDHNLDVKPETGFFQRIVTYDNLPEESLSGIRRKVETDGQGILEKLDRAMAKQDRDSSPKVKGTGRKRATVGVYYLEEDVKED